MASTGRFICFNIFQSQKYRFRNSDAEIPSKFKRNNFKFLLGFMEKNEIGSKLNEYFCAEEMEFSLSGTKVPLLFVSSIDIEFHTLTI